MSLQAHRFQPKSKANAKVQRIKKKRKSPLHAHTLIYWERQVGFLWTAQNHINLPTMLGTPNPHHQKKVICEHRSYKLKKERYHLSAIENEMKARERWVEHQKQLGTNLFLTGRDQPERQWNSISRLLRVSWVPERHCHLPAADGAEEAPPIFSCMMKEEPALL